STDGGATWINDYQGYAGNATIGNTDCGSTPGATCKYRLHADNWLGTGPASNTLSITNPTLPGAPTRTAISGDSYGTVRLTWTPPSSNGGAPLLGYELDRSTDGGATWINDYQGYAGNATIGNTDCGSTPGATCKYRLHADNWLGTGPASNTLSITNPTLPGAPTLTAISGDSYGTVRLTWTVACPAYLIIDSRGSGDPLGTISRPGGAFLAEFLRIHPGYGWALDAPTAGIEVDTNGGPRAAGQYEAVGLPKSVGDAVVFPAKYYLSVRHGESWLTDRLNSFVSSCPSVRVFLTGLSQGAQVTGDVYQSLSRSMPKNLFRNILGVALFGDPLFNSHDTSADQQSLASEGSYTVGIDGALAAILGAPRDLFRSDT